MKNISWKEHMTGLDPDKCILVIVGKIVKILKWLNLLLEM